MRLDLLGTLVQSAHSATIVEGHAAGGDGHVTKHQRDGEDHVIWRETVVGSDPRSVSASRSGLLTALRLHGLQQLRCR